MCCGVDELAPVETAGAQLLLHSTHNTPTEAQLTLGLLPKLDAVSLRCSHGPQVVIILSVAVGEKDFGRGCAVSLPSADLHGRMHVGCQEHAYSGESPLEPRKS